MSQLTSRFDDIRLCTGRRIRDLNKIVERTGNVTYEIIKLSDGWSVFYNPSDNCGESVRLAVGLQDVLEAKAVYIEHNVARLRAIYEKSMNKSDK